MTSTRDGVDQLERRWQPPAGGAARAAVLLVHGIGEHSGRYEHVGRFLAGRGHDVVAIDCRGHGRSGGPRGHVDSFEQLLDDVEDQLAQRRKLGLPVVLVGHSLGGLISATYAVSGRPPPDLLVLSAPALGADVALWQRLLAPVLSRLRPRLFVKSGIDEALLSRDPAVQEAYLSDPLRVAGATARLGQAIFSTMGATSARLDRLVLPIYVLHGADDSLVPSSVSRPLADRPNVTYRLWPGLRHECLNEPEQGEVLAEIDDWLSDQLGRLSDRESAR
jgi:acylglycerol lipase